jgi:protease-4
VSQGRSKTVVGILLIVFTLFFLFVIFGFVAIKNLKGFDGSSSMKAITSDGKGAIGVITVKGVIFKSKKIVQQLIAAEEDDDIKAIIVRVESPGGAVGPTQEIYEEIIRIDQAKKGGKPIYASFGSVAASGGYYIGAATRKIYANSGTITGSIGVIMQFMNLKGVYDFARVKPEIIKAGKYKDGGSPHRDMTAEERGLFNGMINGVHDEFMKDIMKTRGKKLKKPIIELAQGQVFSGRQALELGLIDEIGGLYEAGRRIHKDLKLKGKFGFKFITRKKKVDFAKLFGEVEESVKHIKQSISSQNIPLFIMPQ